MYAGLTKAENVEVDGDGYPVDWSRYWRAAVVRGTEFAYPGRAAELELRARNEIPMIRVFIDGVLTKPSASGAISSRV